MSTDFETIENSELRKGFADVLDILKVMLIETVDIARTNDDPRIYDLSEQAREFANELKKYDPDFELPDRPGAGIHVIETSS